MTLSDFAKSYLAAQGVIVLPPVHQGSRVFAREEEDVPRVPMHERD